MHRYVTANMAGPYHIKNNIVCQDSYCVKKTNENITIAAVADGLGSENSQISAQKSQLKSLLNTVSATITVISVKMKSKN